jgi:hypothetical protein
VIFEETIFYGNSGVIKHFVEKTGKRESVSLQSIESVYFLPFAPLEAFTFSSSLISVDSPGSSGYRNAESCTNAQNYINGLISNIKLTWNVSGPIARENYCYLYYDEKLKR